MSLVIDEIELNDDLLVIVSGGVKRLGVKSGRPKYLPGQARCSLEGDSLDKYLREALSTPDLDRMAPHFWRVSTSLIRYHN
jgi:hypothetical protein